MKILFKFLILFILSITCNATSYDIENLDEGKAIKNTCPLHIVKIEGF